MVQASLRSNLDAELAAVTELWSPRVVAIATPACKGGEGQGRVRVARDADEESSFSAQGTLAIHYRDRPKVVMREGDFSGAASVEHMTAAAEECWVVLVEPAATRHTGETRATWPNPSRAQMAHLQRKGGQTHALTREIDRIVEARV